LVTGKPKGAVSLPHALFSTQPGNRGKTWIHGNPSAGFTSPVEMRSIPLQWMEELLLGFPTLYDYGLGFVVLDPLIR
jgi:hypothetical protein